MRKSIIIALGGAVALVSAAVAIAVVTPAVGFSAATATFSTDRVTELKTRECTGADGRAYKVTDGHYTGTVVSTNAVLAGPLTIHARTTVETTASSDKLGYVEGSFRVRDDDSRLNGKFSGTLQAGKLVGFLTANARGNHAKVLGNISATLDPAATAAFASGQLGSGSTGALAVVAGPVCKGEKPKPNPPAPKPKRVAVEGTLALNTPSAGMVRVTGKGPTTTDCTLGSVPTTGLNTGDRVEMQCEYNTTTSLWMVTKLAKHHH